MQIVPIKVSNALQRICDDIDSQLFFLYFKAGFGGYNVSPVICLSFRMFGLHTLSADWR